MLSPKFTAAVTVVLVATTAIMVAVFASGENMNLPSSCLELRGKSELSGELSIEDSTATSNLSSSPMRVESTIPADEVGNSVGFTLRITAITQGLFY